MLPLKRGAHKTITRGGYNTRPTPFKEDRMKIGDIIKVNGKRCRVTAVYGANYSYAEEIEEPKAEPVEAEVIEEPKAEPVEPEEKPKKRAKK